MAGSKAGIFISYRRTTGNGAGRLYDRMVQELGREHVFMDIDMIELGEDFVDVLDRKLEQAVAVIVMIGLDWMTCADPDGRVRLLNPDDFVRLEVGAALKSGVRVIPVLIDGARMPSSQDLPEDLASLSRRQAIGIDHITFHQDATKLVEACRKMLNDRLTADAPAIEEKKVAEERQRAIWKAEADQMARERAEAERIVHENKTAEERRRAEAISEQERAQRERVAREKKAAGDGQHVHVQQPVLSQPEHDERSPAKKLVLIVAATVVGALLLLFFIGNWGTAVEQKGDEARVAAARQQIAGYQLDLGEYKLDTGAFPSMEQGLDALRRQPAGVAQWHGPYLSKDPENDPWGHSYVYKFPSDHGDEPDLFSYGADGQPGGKGINADITNSQ